MAPKSCWSLERRALCGLWVLACFAACVPSSAFATRGPQETKPKFDWDMYIFGDSLSDIGNLYKRTGAPATNRGYGSPDFPGRFSDSTIWVDNIREWFWDAQVKTYAFGGASMCNDTSRTLQLGIPDIGAQIKMLKADLRQRNFTCTPPTRRVAVVFGGHNDVVELLVNGFNQPDVPAAIQARVLKTIACFQANLQSLIALKLPYISVIGMVPIEQSPFFDILENVTGNPLLRAGLTQAVLGINAGYQAVIAQLAAAYPSVKFSYFDGYSAIKPVEQHPACLSANITKFAPGERCLIFDALNDSSLNPFINIQSTCENPKEYFYYDAIHPNSVAHEYFADKYVKFMMTGKHLPAGIGYKLV